MLLLLLLLLPLVLPLYVWVYLIIITVFFPLVLLFPSSIVCFLVVLLCLHLQILQNVYLNATAGKKKLAKENQKVEAPVFDRMNSDP